MGELDIELFIDEILTGMNYNEENLKCYIERCGKM